MFVNGNLHSNYTGLVDGNCLFNLVCVAKLHNEYSLCFTASTQIKLYLLLVSVLSVRGTLLS